MPLVLENINKSYDGKIVVEGFSCIFPDTGTVAIVGPSGCGKTTLLRLIAKLEQPDSGKVLMPENTVISVVFQEDRLIQGIDARMNIAASLDMDKAGALSVSEYWLERVGLSQAAGKYPAELSGGMKRRVSIARALAFGGDILLLDEPFKGLDREMRDSMMELIFNSQEAEKRLTIMVTHDPQEAAVASEQIDLTPLY